MIIKIKQTESNLKNRFEIKVNNELKYLAGTPWMEINVPFNMDRMRSCVITNTDNSICFTTLYDVVENIANTAIPMKWAFTGEQKSQIYNILDNQNNICGKFYKLTNGIIDTKYVIEYGDILLKSYDVSVGKTRNLLIYNENGQIAEIVKPLSVSNYKDEYILFLLDEYSDLDTILSFFTIVFDYQNYGNNGRTGSQESVQIKYTYSKNNKFYDKNWITNHFPKEEVDSIYSQILENRKNTTNSIKKQGKYILLTVGLIWLVLLIIFGIFFIFF